MDMLTVEEVADRLRVHPGTVKRWLREGALAGYRLGDRAGWRISQDDLARFLEERRGEAVGGKVAA